jgi:hypothetical protein
MIYLKEKKNYYKKVSIYLNFKKINSRFDKEKAILEKQRRKNQGK